MRLPPLLLLLALLPALLLTGCAGLARQPVHAAPTADDVRIVVFNDGFHGGFLLPARPELAFLDPVTTGAPATWPWIEVGFGADAWVAAQDPGCCTATWLAFSRSDAVLMCERWPDEQRKPRDPQTPIHFWSLTLSPASWSRLVATVRLWVVDDLIQPRRPEQARFMRFAVHKWSSFRNCNDFVVDALESAGLDLSWRAIYTSGIFTGVMDKAAAELASTGPIVIGVPP